MMICLNKGGNNMAEEIENSLNETFKELFTNNYMWLIVLSIVTIIILIIFIFVHTSGNSTFQKETEKQLKELKSKIRILEQNNRINSSNSSNTTLAEISKQIDDLKKTISKTN